MLCVRTAVRWATNVCVTALTATTGHSVRVRFLTNTTWWRHQMETLSALLAICAGNSPVTGESPHKGQWRGALMFSFICVWINSLVKNRDAGDLRRFCAYYGVIVMETWMKWLPFCRETILPTELITSEWQDNCDAITWMMIFNSLDIDFINGDIRGWSSKMGILVRSLLKFVPRAWIGNNSALFQTITWRRTGDKALSDAMQPKLLTHILRSESYWLVKAYIWLNRKCLFITWAAHPNKYARGSHFVVLNVFSNGCFTHIIYGCFTGTGEI